MSPTAKTKKRTVFGQSVFVCFMRKNVSGCGEVFRLPLTRARRVKKICRWHIFSQSGEQVILATRAIGCHEVTEGEIEQTLKGTLSLLPSFASQNPPPSSEGGLQGTMPTSSRLEYCDTKETGGCGHPPLQRPLSQPRLTALLKGEPLFRTLVLVTTKSLSHPGRGGTATP